MKVIFLTLYSSYLVRRDVLQAKYFIKSVKEMPDINETLGIWGTIRESPIWLKQRRSIPPLLKLFKNAGSCDIF